MVTNDVLEAHRDDARRIRLAPDILGESDDNLTSRGQTTGEGAEHRAHKQLIRDGGRDRIARHADHRRRANHREDDWVRRPHRHEMAGVPRDVNGDPPTPVWVRLPPQEP